MINRKIQLKSSLGKDSVKAMARRIWKETPMEIDDKIAIYIEQPKVSDLFIATKFGLHTCTQEEWREYFYTFIGIPPKQKKKEIYFYSGIRHK